MKNRIQNSRPLFPIQKGIKQGDTLSPKLSTATLEEVFEQLDTSCKKKSFVVGDLSLPISALPTIAFYSPFQ